MANLMADLETELALAFRRIAERDLPGLPESSRPISSEPNLRTLALYASILSLSSDPLERNRAYDAATVLLLSLESDSVHAAVAYEILVRLGNFPASELAAMVHKISDEQMPAQFYFAQKSKKFRNTLSVGDRSVTLTDFQLLVEKEIAAGDRIVSVSAPTSAGKTFLLCVDIARQLHNGTASTIVYIVPTRALARQVAQAVREEVEAHGFQDVQVRVLPPKPNSGPEGPRTVYVFTQERLLSLLNDHKVSIDMLYVDEAQNIGEGGRGVLLQHAIELGLKSNYRCRAIVVAPMVANPGEIARVLLGEGGHEGTAYSSNLVGQNLFLVDTVSMKTMECRVSLMERAGLFDLGVRKLSYRFRSDSRKTTPIAQFSIDITRDGDVTLIYSTGPAEAEKVAEDLCALLPEPVNNPSLVELSQFAREEVHPNYSLADFLEKGVAYHYAMIPGIIRTRIEELVERGDIRFVAATTTLLSGVNLPLKNLVIASPRKGNQVMDGFEFWNLAGRAGRLGREFYGNIWVLRIDRWAREVYLDDRQINVRSSFEQTINTEGQRVLDALRRPEAVSEDSGAADAAASKIYFDALSTGVEFSDSQYGALVSPSISRGIDQEVQRLREIVPLEVAKAAPGVSPSKVADLWKYLRTRDLDSLLPLHPLRSDAYNRLEEIVHLLQFYIQQDHSKTYRYLTFMANSWMREEPLRNMIASKIRRDQEQGKYQRVSDAIREVLETLERKVRHYCARNFRIFAAAFEALCKIRGKENLIERVSPLSMYLDAGACTDETLFLLGRGLSRTSAIKLANLVRGQGRDGVQRLLQQRGIERTLENELPPICLNEVRRLRVIGG